MTQIVDTNGGQDFSSITPAMIVDISGNYVDISVSGTFGDVDGPASSTDRNIAIFNGTTGKIIKDAGVGISTAGVISIPDGGGFSSQAAGQLISLTASSGVYVGGGSDDITLSTSAGINLNSSGPIELNNGNDVLIKGNNSLVVSKVTTYFSGTYVYVDGLVLPNSANAQIGQASPNSFKSIFAKNFGTDLVSSGVTATGTYDIDLRNGMSINYDFTGCPSGTVNFTLSNPTAGSAWILTTKQNASGTVAVNWPSSIKWQGGVSGTMTSTSGTSPVDMFSLYCASTSPATYYASFSNNYY